MKIEFKLDKQKAPTVDQGVKVTYGEARRTGYRLRWFLLLAAIIGPSVAAAYWLFLPKVLTIAPGVVTYHAISLRVDRDSTIEEISVSEGEEVEQGETLLRLKDDVLNTEIRYLTDEIAKLKEHAQLNEEDDQKIAVYEKAVADAFKNFEEVKQIKKKFDRYNAQGQVSTSDYVVVLNNYASAQNQLSQSQIELSDAINEMENELIAGDVAKTLRSLENELLVKKTERRELTLQAPFDARVIQIADVVGKNMEEDDRVVTVADSDQAPEITAYLDAKYVDEARLNSEAVVILPNGDKHDVVVSKPIELAAKLPQHLAKPFKGQKALIQVSLQLVNVPEDTSEFVEGMPVEVRF
ncbi:hypothetical protein JCM19241_759 [Vibrio ishigakensis]|uniref:Membrane fusion protein biotin-lipoyl like domain-containing protein n=1 Tax=Vibrio ishigakensis TaxID=1481914 RepID=A0A0B8QHK6_9VIBR|nr:hypothetical protein JCM19241_759 [Vibrio ishigakensis]